MPVATITSKGQVTIPKSVRMHFLLKAGDPVEFRLEKGGGCRFVPKKRKVADVFGILAGKVKHPQSVEAMNEAIRKRFL